MNPTAQAIIATLMLFLPFLILMARQEYKMLQRRQSRIMSIGRARQIAEDHNAAVVINGDDMTATIIFRDGGQITQPIA